MLMVTGGAGFIGANFVRHWLHATDDVVCVVDKLTYSGNPANLGEWQASPRVRLERIDICDTHNVMQLVAEIQPSAIVHFAAESHVDRSIHGPADFVQTNVVGTFSLLEVVRSHLSQADAERRTSFRFLHVSTDEVYGSLSATDPPAGEVAPYAPNNPYAATKAGSDHLVRACFGTYSLPVMTVHCSNNYGPYQFPEKLIPLTILNAVCGEPLPIYGDGSHSRDWLYVADTCDAIAAILRKGRPGEVYNLGGRCERRNIEVVRTICSYLNAIRPKASGSYADQIAFVADRPGHDRRYALDSGKVERELGWKPRQNFDDGVRLTVDWYLGHPDWVNTIRAARNAAVGPPPTWIPSAGTHASH